MQLRREAMAPFNSSSTFLVPSALSSSHPPLLIVPTVTPALSTFLSSHLSSSQPKTFHINNQDVSLPESPPGGAVSENAICAAQAQASMCKCADFKFSGSSGGVTTHSALSQSLRKPPKVPST